MSKIVAVLKIKGKEYFFDHEATGDMLSYMDNLHNAGELVEGDRIDLQFACVHDDLPLITRDSSGDWVSVVG